jgi:hypothetical protein
MTWREGFGLVIVVLALVIWPEIRWRLWTHQWRVGRRR